MRRVLLVLAAVVSVAAFAGPPGHANLTSGTVSVACSPGQCGSFYGVVEVAEAAHDLAVDGGTMACAGPVRECSRAG
jgi:hypothetical protein